jgi:methionine synthase II (cobalamin-independent)
MEQLDEDSGTYYVELEAADITYRSGDWSGGTSDYFRGIVAGTNGFQDGISQAPVTRRFDTNTFFREPTIEGPLHARQKDGEAVGYPKLIFRVGGEGYQPTYISPYAFARLAARAEGVSEANAHRYIGELYDQLFDDAVARKVTHVLFNEPYAPYHEVDKNERAILKHAIGNLAANHPSLEVGVFFGFGNGAEFVRDFAADERVAAIGCDLRKTPADELPKLPDHRFLAGVVDGANTLIRNDEEIVAELEAVEAATGSYEISVTHNIDLEFVPRTYALKKIEQIGRVAQARKEINNG